MSTSRPEALREHWQALLASEPQLRIRDAAERLGAAEAELVALGCGTTATRLDGPWDALLRQLHTLGPLLGLTRNDHAVHERHGRYERLASQGRMRIVGSPGFEAWLFLDRWHSGYAVQEIGHGQVRQSLQFFDERGGAVHKIYQTQETLPGTLETLVRQFRSADQSPDHLVAAQPEVPATAEQPRFWPRHDVEGPPPPDPIAAHPAAIRPPAVARAVDRTAAEIVLREASAQAIPLLIAVGNPGALQFHRGPVTAIRRTGPWINVLDASFNLHLRDEQVASAWVIEEDADTGPKRWLGLADRQGQPVAQLSCLQPSARWDALLQGLAAAVTAGGPAS